MPSPAAVPAAAIAFITLCRPINAVDTFVIAVEPVITSNVLPR
jgi:hypothetical protein